MTTGSPAAGAPASEGKIGRDAWMALVMSALSYAVCFASWVINAVLVTHLVNQGLMAFSEAQVSLLLAAPILTGSISRVPVGMLADRIGGRRVFLGLML